MKKLSLYLLGFAVILSLSSCKCSTKKNTYEISSESTSSLKETIDDDPYINNSLYTGSVPYECYEKSGSNSKITIITSTQSESDLVVMIKQGENLVHNAYIKAGDKYSFLLPNGTYQVFFYSGRGWNPGKEMPNGLKGGFVTDESYSKDSPISLSYQEMVYELILQQNGNFSTQQSSEDEIF